MENNKYVYTIMEATIMKVFISWSGELSQKIAESIKKWLPSFINQVEVFFSREDIEKGENWDSKISKELSDCKYGIICLTKENVNAPWINFEAGAIAKALDSRTATLMVNINPSDVKGPLSRYQATKLEKDDLFQLITNINKQCDNPVIDSVLENTFNGLWNSMHTELEKAISEHKVSSGKTKKETNNNDTLEEMLLLLRKQSSILSSPQQLLPEDYFEHIWERYLKSPNSEKNIDLCFEIIDYLSWILSKAEVDTTSYNLLEQLGFYNLIDILGRYINRRSNRRLYMNYLNLRDKYRMIASQKISVVDTIGIQDEDIMS